MKNYPQYAFTVVKVLKILDIVKIENDFYKASIHKDGEKYHTKCEPKKNDFPKIVQYYREDTRTPEGFFLVFENMFVYNEEEAEILKHQIDEAMKSLRCLEKFIQDMKGERP